ncbi:MAG: GDSL-type esterase/lipase family protein [Bacteroidales bacterium]|nr:GDSL-type esterase/lipase family protein [Bacteroidales bacterium]
MKKYNVIALVIISVIFGIGLLCYVIYQRNINIYESVSIRFNDIEISDTNLIHVLSVSPLGRYIPIKYNYNNQCWKTSKGSYSKSIILVVNENISYKIKSVIVEFENKIFDIPIDDLEILTKLENEIQYVLPAEIRSENAFFRKAAYIVSGMIKTIIIVFLAIVLLAVLVYFFRKNSNKIMRKQLILKWLKIVGFSIVIALGLFYGYLLVKYTLSCYITAILLIIISGLVLWYFSKLILKLYPMLAKHSGKIKKILLIIIAIWFCIETVLRITGINKSYNEKLTSYYSSGFINNNKADPANPHLFVNIKNSIVFDKKSEFTYEMRYNNDGLRDIDHLLEKQKDEVRIVCLGNSFTEGIGAPYDSTWPKLLEDKLKKVCNKQVTVFNAGISGSDPFFSYMLLKERMLKYKPDIVLVALQVTDFNFYRFRGGFERFTENGVHYRKPPVYEKIYAVSYVFRFLLNDVMGYKKKYLQSKEDYNKDSIQANIDIENCIYQYYQLSLQEDFKLAIVFIDSRYNSRYAYLIDKFKKDRNLTVIDLIDYNKNIENLTFEDLESYFWKIDMHCNSNGYKLISKGIVWNFSNLGILDSLNNLSAIPDD